jgi:hypothetical protein
VRSPWYQNNIWQIVQIMKLLITQFSPGSSYSFPIRSKYFLNTLFSNTLRLCYLLLIIMRIIQQSIIIYLLSESDPKSNSKSTGLRYSVPLAEVRNAWTIVSMRNTSSCALLFLGWRFENQISVRR